MTNPIWIVNFDQETYLITPSKRKNKKYDVFKIKKDKSEYMLSFGALKIDGTPYEQYKDQFGHYKKYDHNDKIRQKNFWKRHTHSEDPTSANFWNKFLW